jgi:recA bacterial DNA recombination protein
VAAALIAQSIPTVLSARHNLGKNSSNTLDLRKHEWARVNRGSELTRKTRRLASNVPLVDQLISGGIARGRINELTGSAGKTSLATAFAVSALRNGEVVGWLDLEGRFDPDSMNAAGVDLARMLWTSPAHIEKSRLANRTVRFEALANEETNGEAFYRESRKACDKPERAMLKAAEWLMAAGGFGLVVIDFGALRWPLRPSVAMRLARGAEQSGAAVIVLSARRMCGTFAALSLVFASSRASFSRACPEAPLLFEGFVTDLRVARNKLGRSHGAIALKLTADPYAIDDSEEMDQLDESISLSAIADDARAVS